MLLFLTGVFSFIGLVFSDKSMSMQNEERPGTRVVSAKISGDGQELNDKDRRDFARVFLERLHKLSGKPLEENQPLYVDVDHREDKVWINSQGKRIILESK